MPNMNKPQTALTKYDAARFALAEAAVVDEAKDIRDKAMAMAAYARQAKDQELLKWATEIKVRAERKCGEMLRDGPKNPGAKGIGPIVVAPCDRNRIQTLAQIGVTKTQSSRWQKLAAVPEDQFEQAVAAALEIAGEVTTEVIIAVREQNKEAKQRARESDLASRTQTAETRPTIEQADAIEWLSRQDPCDLLLTDPPYSTDVDDIQAFAESWLPLALSKVKPTGRAFVFIGAYPAELAGYLATAMPEQVLVWTYRNTLGPTPSHNYKLNWQAILYFKGEDAPPLDCPVMLEQFSVQDINAPDGRQGDRYHAWQKPLDIADRFIRHSTKPGDTVLDPFACTGTFLIAGAALGRIAKGCDISEENIAIAGGRGCLISGAI